MAENENNAPEQVSWNLSQILIQEIGGLIAQGSYAYRKGRVNSCFFAFQEIRVLIHADLSKEEKEFLDGLDRQRRGLKSNDPKNISFVRKYREKIMDLLSKYGYLISKKIDEVKMF